ncbi:universal stress protein [Streptomyces sp. NPDC053560]|uniref:universal stress protein n=1 Tax=Streptomyces sp. NPDC053560 TaxID=3365711 RepID=UPI0037D53ABD
MSRQIVAGVDGSSPSLRAVAAAAYEARLHGRCLRVVHAYQWPAAHVPRAPERLGLPEGGLRDVVDRMLTDAMAHARTVAPEVQVGSAVVTGDPLTVLEHESGTAALVVVGHRGLGGLAGPLLGSVGMHLASHSRCPVMVVRGRRERMGGVLLGVDGSPGSAAAVRFAFAEASLREVPLVAVHTWNTWTSRVYDGPADPPGVTYDVDRLRDEEERLLTEALAGWTETYPDVVVERRVMETHTRHALIEASSEAQLVVVGARGLGGLSGLLLGSVGRALLCHARCPVVVVRGAGAPS